MTDTFYRSYTDRSKQGRIGYVRGKRARLERFVASMGAHVETWHVPERASAQSQSATALRLKSDSYKATFNRESRSKSRHMVPAELPRMRGDFLLVSVEHNAARKNQTTVIAQCTARECAESSTPHVARLTGSEWIAPLKVGRLRCRSCASFLRAAIDRAVKARTRGQMPEVRA